jgi:molecular chaperone GrpE
MSDKKEKRKIRIEDRRTSHEADGNGASPDDLAAAAPADAVAAEGAAAADEVKHKAAQAYAQQQAGMKSAPDGDSAEKTESEIEELNWQAKADEYLDLAQRKEAALQNMRKRLEQEKEDARRFVIEGLLFDLFPVLDGLTLAEQTYSDTPDGENPLLDGVRRTIKVLEKALTKHGIQKIDQAQEPFDPALHDALSVEESEECAEVMVAEVFVEGYRLGDQVLKPAKVRVVKPVGDNN